MVIKANSPQDYISKVPTERKEALEKLREVIKNNLPRGFKEGMLYNMLGYFVPHSLYPDGYHCKPTEPLPFINVASQKASINLYHMGMYAKKELLDWFVAEYPKHCKQKLDMGKSCVRFKKIEEIPYDLIGELCSKITVKEWVNIYETTIRKK